MPKKNTQSRSIQKNQAENLTSEGYFRQKTNNKRNQNKIFNSLRSHYPKPMSTNDLIQDIGLDGATILKHGKELIKKGLVSRKDDDSKRAAYELTPLALGDAPELRGQSFESMAYHKIMVQCIPAFDNKLIKKHIPKNTTSEEIELAIFESKIGAYITYVMIEAMRDKHQRFQDSGNIKKDDLVKKWINGAIHPERILIEFKNLDSLYEIQNEEEIIKIEKLRLAFQNLHPAIFRDLEYTKTKQVQELVDDRVKVLQERYSKKYKKI